MIATDSLSPVEARGLHRRRAVAQWALGIFFVAAVGALVALGYEGHLVWFVACMPGAVVCLLLHIWGMRCPRCRNSVFGRKTDESSAHPSDPGLGPRLPDRCMTCGVWLVPAQVISGPGGFGAMGVSIYYSACRPEPLSAAEQLAVAAAIARYPLAALLDACGVSEGDFDGEDFCIYPADRDTEPGVVFEGATKLPLCSENAMWAAVQHWCQLLSEVRRAMPGASWRVHVEDQDIPWAEGERAFDPSV